MLPILFVTPNETMASDVRATAKELNVEIYAEIVNNSNIQHVMDKYSDVEVFIGRGMIAKTIKKKSNKPLVLLSMTMHEIFSKVNNLTVNGCSHVGVLAYPELIGHLKSTYEIGDKRIEFYPSDLSDLKSGFNDLKRNGIDGIVGGGSTITLAKEAGLAYQMLENGKESMAIAIKEAISIYEDNKAQRQREKDIESHSMVLHDAIGNAYAAIEELTASSEELAAIGKENEGFAKEASERVNKTSEVIDIVRGISSQTNLLGLNAAIEAARSGEHGRGFAVVASEVRKLADSSAIQSNQVSEMLGALMTIIDSLMKNIEQTSLISQEQAKANENVSEMIEQLTGISQTLADMANNRHS